MSVIGDFAANGGTAATLFTEKGCRLVSDGIAIFCDVIGQSHVQLAAYSVADGSLIWQRTGTSTEFLQHSPILAHGGKLLVRVEKRTLHAAAYEGLGITESESIGGPTYFRILDWIGLDCVNQLFPISTTYYEVIELSSGDTLAQASFDLGSISHSLLVPTGTVEVLDAGPEPDDAESFPSGALSPPREAFELISGTWYPKAWSLIFLYDGAWWRKNKAYALAGVDYFQWIKWPATTVSAAHPIPQPHATLDACVSTDGSAIVFSSLATPSEDMKYSSLLVEGAITDVSWGAPHTSGHAQSVYAYDWDLEPLWSSSLGNVLAPGNVLAVGDDVVAWWFSGTDSLTHYRRLNPATGATIDEETNASSLQEVITTKTALVGRNFATAKILTAPLA